MLQLLKILKQIDLDKEIEITKNTLESVGQSGDNTKLLKD